MQKVKGFQKKYLWAHDLKAVVFVGHKGLTAEDVRAAGEALDNPTSPASGRAWR